LKFKRRLPADDEAVPMSSMADIAFLLVIFFMTASVLALDQGLVIELPETSVRESVDRRELLLTIAEDGQVYADGQPVALDDLGPKVLSVRRANPRRPVVVRSDRRVRYGLVADVMDELLQAGVRDVALPTAPEEGVQ
jgi:biopolymer transport protein ExbD